MIALRPCGTRRLQIGTRRSSAATGKKSLGFLLNLSAQKRETLEVASRLGRLRSAVLPPLEELVSVLAETRPDLGALRVGERRAEVDLARGKAVPIARRNEGG